MLDELRPSGTGPMTPVAPATGDGAEADDLGRQPAHPRIAQLRALTPQVATRVGEPAPRTGDRKRHLRLLRAHAELGEQPRQQWIVARVVDQEAGIEGEVRSVGTRDEHRVGVAAGTQIALEHVDVVDPREGIGSPEARRCRCR